jgi:hypothetical protein
VYYRVYYCQMYTKKGRASIFILFKLSMIVVKDSKCNELMDCVLHHITADSGVVKILNICIDIFNSYLREELVQVGTNFLDSLFDLVSSLSVKVGEPTSIPQDKHKHLKNLLIECYGYSYDRLHLQLWNEVPLTLKRAFALTTIVYTCLDILLDGETNKSADVVIGQIKLCDLGLLLGGGPGYLIKLPARNDSNGGSTTTLHHQLLALIELLTDSLNNIPAESAQCTPLLVSDVLPQFQFQFPRLEHVDVSGEKTRSKRARLEDSAGVTTDNTKAQVCPTLLPTCCRTGRRLGSVACLQAGECSLEVFYKDYFWPKSGIHGGTPLLLEGGIDHWPAMQPSGERAWANLEYLRRGK